MMAYILELLVDLLLTILSDIFSVVPDVTRPESAASGSSSEPQPSTSRQSPPPPQRLPKVSPNLQANWAHEFVIPWAKMSRRNLMSYLERNVRPPPGSICKAGDGSSNHRQPSGQPWQEGVGLHCPTDRDQISYWSVLFYVPY